MDDISNTTTIERLNLNINTPLDELPKYVPGKGFGFTQATLLTLRRGKKSAWRKPGAAVSLLNTFLIHWKIRGKLGGRRQLRPKAEDIIKFLHTVHGGEAILLDLFGRDTAKALRDGSRTALDVVVLVLLDIEREVVKVNEREKRLSMVDGRVLQLESAAQYHVSTVEWVRNTIFYKIAPELHGVKSFAESLLEGYESTIQPPVVEDIVKSPANEPPAWAHEVAEPAFPDLSKQQIKALGTLYRHLMPAPPLGQATIAILRDNLIRWESGVGAEFVDIHAELVGQMGVCLQEGNVAGYEMLSGQLFADLVRMLYPG